MSTWPFAAELSHFYDLFVLFYCSGTDFYRLFFYCRSIEFQYIFYVKKNHWFPFTSVTNKSDVERTLIVGGFAVTWNLKIVEPLIAIDAIDEQKERDSFHWIHWISFELGEIGMQFVLSVNVSNPTSQQMCRCFFAFRFFLANNETAREK